MPTKANVGCQTVNPKCRFGCQPGGCRHECFLQIAESGSAVNFVARHWSLEEVSSALRVINDFHLQPHLVPLLREASTTSWWTWLRTWASDIIIAVSSLLFFRPWLTAAPGGSMGSPSIQIPLVRSDEVLASNFFVKWCSPYLIRDRHRSMPVVT